MNWYKEVGPEVPISQGDILIDCPIFLVDPDCIKGKDPRTIQELTTLVATDDVVVMTQACDLEQSKNDQVVVAQLREAKGNGWPLISEVLSERRPALCLLGKHEGEKLKMSYRIVDFRTLYTIPTRVLNDIAKSGGTRLRLNTPHRELLSRRFGNYFARIGLPNEDHINKADLKASLGL